jgi:hypothetical protein
LSANKREFERIAVQLRVRFPRDNALVEAQTRDLSLGGAFVTTTEVLPYGATTVAELWLPALPTPAQIPCVVRWSSPEGMGLQFLSLRARETWAINQLFRG